MKRKLFFTGLILSLATFINLNSCTPTFAEEVIDEVRYWSVSDMIEFRDEVNAEMEEVCLGDAGCEEDLYYEHLESGESKYWALDLFENISLMFTSINPSNDTIKLYFNSKDKMLSRMFGYDVYHYITDFYTLWIEEWIGDPTLKMGWLMYGYRYPNNLGSKEDAISASHVLVDTNWLEPDIELEFNVEGGDIVNDTAHRLFYSLLDNEGGRTDGIYEYGSCIDSPYYRYGSECRLMFSEYGEMIYLPFSTGEEDYAEPETPLEEGASTEDETVVTDPETDSGQETTIVDADPNSLEELEEFNSESASEEGKGQNITDSDHQTTDNDSPKIAILTPNTGAPLSENYTSEFPWWLTLILIFNGLIILWLFWPEKSKKSKKSIDKLKEVR